MAESARGEMVEPLKEEVERMKQQLEEAQAMYEVNTTKLISAAGSQSSSWLKFL